MCIRDRVWDATVVSPLAGSYVDRAATGAGAVADLATVRKLEKYSSLTSQYIVQPVAVENLGVVSLSALQFLSELGRRMSVATDNPQETLFLFQRISVSIQRFNSVLLHESFVVNIPD